MGISAERYGDSSNIKSSFFKLLLCVFLASIFFDDPNLYLWKRLIFSIFLYISLWYLIVIYYQLKTNGFQFPTSIIVFYRIYGVFFAINLIRTILSPDLNVITLINHPLGALAAIPVFAFGVGFYSSKEDIVKILKIICVAFPIFFFPNPLSKVSYYPGYICSAAVVPAFIFSLESKKGRIFYGLLIIIELIFSHISEYRVLTLNVLIFICLYVSLNLFKKAGFVKFLIMGTVFVSIFLVVTNLEYCLEVFGRLFGSKVVDTDDTRSFLFQELFGDLKPQELLFGRGFLGTYFSDYFLTIQKQGDSSGDYYKRFAVEVGFLQLILKGGYVYVFLYLFPLAFTSIKGIFSKRISPLSFNLSIYLIVAVLTMFFEYIPSYSFNFFLLFFVAGFIYRELIDENIHNNAVQESVLIMEKTVQSVY